MANSTSSTNCSARMGKSAPKLEKPTACKAWISGFATWMTEWTIQPGLPNIDPGELTTKTKTSLLHFFLLLSTLSSSIDYIHCLPHGKSDTEINEIQSQRRTIMEHGQMGLLEAACGWLHHIMHKSDFVTRGSVLLTAPERMQHCTFFYSGWSSRYSGSGLDTYSGLKLRIKRGKGSKKWNMREAMAELIPGSFCSLGFDWKAGKKKRIKLEYRDIWYMCNLQ